MTMDNIDRALLLCQQAYENAKIARQDGLITEAELEEMKQRLDGVEVAAQHHIMRRQR